MSANLEKRPPQDSTAPLVEEVHLQDYLNVLFRRRRLFTVVFFAVFLSVALFTFLMKPVYEATATLHVNKDKLKSADFMAQLGLRNDSSVETEIEILKARTNIEGVVRKLQLDWRDPDVPANLQLQVEEFSTPYPDREFIVTKMAETGYRITDATGAILGDAEVGRRFECPELLLKIDRIGGRVGEDASLKLAWFDAYVKIIRNDVRATEVGKGTNVILVAYQHQNPVSARNVVNALTQVYLDRSVALKAEEARKSVEFIEEQLKEVRKQLDNAEKGLQDFKRDTGMVRLDAEAENLIARMAQLEKERIELILRKRQAEFAIDGVREALRSGHIYSPAALMDDPVLASLARNLADMEVERQGMMVEHSDGHPQIRILNDRIVETEQKTLATYRSHRETLNDRIAEVYKQLAADENQLLMLPAAEQELARLTRLARVNSDIYTFLLQKHEEARIARAVTISSIDVIDPAIVPVEPVKPRKAKNLLFGIAIGLMLGLGMAFFMEYMDDTIKDTEEAKKVFDLPLLAVIPHIGEQVREEESAKKIDSALICAFKGRSAAAEAFRSLRTNLHFAASGHKKILLVTSSFPGEGKTTLAANLALTIAQTGARVLLIGCDLRRPSLSRLFNLESTPGLTEYLIGDAVQTDIIRTTPFTNLDFIPSGTVPPNPAELLGSGAMQSLLVELRERYAFVILDAPPMFAVTDAALLSPMSELVLVVLEVGRVPVKVAKRLRESFEHLQVPLGGLVMNDKTGKGSEYYGYYGSGYYYGPYGYGYGYGSDTPERRKPFLLRLLSRVQRKLS